jgi:nucleoside triphosphate diphosphatase
VKIEELIKVVRTLRKKCPWDRRQTLRSMRASLIEEAYETVDAIDRGDPGKIREEVGDILFLGIFLAELLAAEKGISLRALVRSTVEKYRRKHPHVWGRKKLRSADEVVSFWQRAKPDVFAGIPAALPALMAAVLVQERAARLGFDWESHRGPMRKVAEELRELKDALNTRRAREEYGDLLFACVNLARHIGADPEDALRRANRKFIRRFRRVEKELAKRGKKPQDATLQEMDRIWDRIKQ